MMEEVDFQELVEKAKAIQEQTSSLKNENKLLQNQLVSLQQDNAIYLNAIQNLQNEVLHLKNQLSNIGTNTLSDSLKTEVGELIVEIDKSLELLGKP